MNLSNRPVIVLQIVHAKGITRSHHFAAATLLSAASNCLTH
jgi:hypothetical protein